MAKKYTSLKFNARIKPINDVNTEFTLCKVYVQGIGKNRNFTYMSKDSVQKALPTLNYCPVVGHLIEKEDGSLYMGGHDWEITEDWEFKDLTVPLGVVIEDSFDYEIVEEYGEEVEYLTAMAYLWTGRYPTVKEAVYSEDIWFNQSMEINLDDGNFRPYSEDSNYIELLDWNYSALCLLGKSDNPEEHTEPCFISSKVSPAQETFSLDKFNLAIEEMKEQLKKCYKANQQPTETDDIDVTNSTKGGNEDLEEQKKKKKKLIDESEEEVSETVVEEEVETEDPDEKEKETKTPTEEGTEEPVEKETEEEPEVEPTDEPEGDSAEPADVEASVEEEEKPTEFEILQAEFEEYKKNHSVSNEEVEELRAFKLDVEAKERQESLNEIFSSFEKKLGEVEEFNQLRENCDDLELTEVENKCYCILGKVASNFSLKTEKKENVAKVKVEKEFESKVDDYGGILTSRYEK